MTKLTKKEMFERIMMKLSYDSDVVEFCEHEIALLAKKNGTRKPTAKQIENEALKEEIVKVLEKAEKPLAVSEIMENSEMFVGKTPQRISALITQLKNTGTVVRIEEKRKAYFRLA